MSASSSSASSPGSSRRSTSIPEFVPVLGPIDDIVVAVVAMRFVRRRMGVEDLRRRWSGSPGGFDLLLRVIGAG